MSQVIAGLYELGERLGAGMGGIAYRGWHMRLEKPVVLKADKRTLSTDSAKLKREVNILKDIHNTYIPQVYDYVQENGVVYTVMDYIEGESLDKLLERGQIPEQAQVIRWADQLLKALCCLHGQPPHGILHSDIKPANIMLRPNGDICLIDYNVALALGEEGAVKGYSEGYASPEHYEAENLQKSSRASRQGGTDDTIKLDKEAQEADRRRTDDTVKLDEEAQEEGQKGTDDTIKLDEEVPEAGGRGADDTIKLDEEVPGEVHRGTDNTVKLDGTDAQAQPHGTGAKLPSASGHACGGKKRVVLLDVRSDIYGLGATLYHLLSGTRPAERAVDVVPLGPEVCSPAVSAILQKAMAPEPEKRYQTAEEMRRAFLNLHRTDRRTVRHRRRMAVCAGVLAGTFLLGGGTAFAGQRQLGQIQEAYALAGYSADALAKGDVSGAVRLALQAVSTGEGVLDAPVTAQAQKALADALGVYDLSDGFKSAGTIELTGAPFDLSVSPGGTRLAVVYGFEAAIYDLEGQKRIAALPIQNSALSDCLFLDEDRVVYAGKDGVACYDLEAQETVWTGETAAMLAVSADGSTVAAVDRDADHAVIYRAADGKQEGECPFDGLHMAVAVNDIFADPKDTVFSLNADGSLLAVSFENGGLTIFDLQDREESMTVCGESEYTRFSGRYFAFAAKGSRSWFGIVDTEEAFLAVSLESGEDFLLEAGEDGIYLGNGNVLVEVDASAFKELELAYTGSVRLTNFAVGSRYTLAATEDNNFSFFDSGAHLMATESGEQNADFMALTEKYAVIGNRTEHTLRVLALEDHAETQLAAYDARYDHTEAWISADGETVTLYGKDSFRIYDKNARLLAERSLPDAEYIYDQQFRREDGDSYLEVIWYDGTRRFYSAADGALISEKVSEAPSRDLYEEFFVGKYRIASSLHEAPVVYDMDSGRQAAVLEADGYLAYVWELGDCYVTEYIDTAGMRYGLLLDSRFETIAYLPGLCDVAGELLVFDYGSGNLRQSRLYSLQELIALGEAQ